MQLRWYGQSTFTLTTPGGVKILMDPMGPETGYGLSPIEGINVVTVSHEHFDHNNIALATGSPTVLRGLEAGGWATIRETIGDVAIRNVATYHDESSGAERGLNSIFVFEVGGMHLVHLGDLGHVLSADQVAAIGPVDILMIPVGGVFTIDAGAATRVMEQLSPPVIIPMHYKTADLSPGLPLAPVDNFLSGKQVQRVGSNTITIAAEALPEAPTVMVLDYE